MARIDERRSAVCPLWLIGVTSVLSIACQKIGSAIKVDGSSTVFPITKAVAEEFQKTERVSAPILVSGTTGGFRRFCAGEIDITGASRPINAAEVGLCRQSGVDYIEVPIAYDGLAVVVNRRNTWASDITVDELRKTWEPNAERRLLRWSEIRDGWPNRELHLCGPGPDSGTYDYFTEAIGGRERESRKDYFSSEDDAVLVECIARDELALGYFGYAYYVQNTGKLKALAVDDRDPKNGAGPVPPSIETVRNGSYQPLSRPLFIYVAKASLDKPEVTAFVNFYLEKGARVVGKVGYIPLPIGVYTLAMERVAARRTGSLFAGRGSQVGVPIERLLQKEGSAEVR